MNIFREPVCPDLILPAVARLFWLLSPPGFATWQPGSPSLAECNEAGSGYEWEPGRRWCLRLSLASGRLFNNGGSDVHIKVQCFIFLFDQSKTPT